MHDDVNYQKLVSFTITMFHPLDYIGQRWTSYDSILEYIRLNLPLVIVDMNFHYRNALYNTFTLLEKKKIRDEEVYKKVEFEKKMEENL